MADSVPTWTDLSETANITQLAGVDFFKITLLVIRFAKSPKILKKRCRRLGKSCEEVWNLLQQIKEAGSMEDTGIREPLKRLEDAVRKAFIPVDICRNGSTLDLLTSSCAITKSLDEAQEEVDECLKNVPLVNTNLIVKCRKDDEKWKKSMDAKVANIQRCLFEHQLHKKSKDITCKTDYECFPKKWAHDQRVKVLDCKERESSFNERVIPLRKTLKEKVKARQVAPIESFSDWPEERCTRIRNGKKSRKAAVKGFKQLLDEASISITHETTYESFSRQWGNDQRFGAINRTQKESLLNERVLSSRIAFKEKGKAIETAASIASRKAKLGDRVDINSSWPAVNGSLSSDPRYKAAKRRRKNRVDYVAEMRATEEDTERATIAERKKENLTSDQNQRNVNGDFRTLRVQLNNFDAKEMAVIECLLKTTPALETMEIRIPRRFTKMEEKNMQFLADILSLPRASSQARICMQLK